MSLTLVKAQFFNNGSFWMMSDQPTPQQQPEPPQPEPEPEKENGEKEVENGEDTTQLYHRICEALGTQCAADESPEEFKVRVVTEFSDMTQWPDEKYEVLSQDIQDWVYTATTTHKGNTNKKRKKNMPALPGLDPAPEAKQKRARVSLTMEPKRGRTRTTGDDCLTRTMKILIAANSPENLKADDLVSTLHSRYGKEYSKAAVRYAQQAFMTARELLQKTPA
jgi:hypothetical protein